MGASRCRLARRPQQALRSHEHFGLGKFYPPQTRIDRLLNSCILAERGLEARLRHDPE